MRPKKRVLVYCADELTLSTIAFVLSTKGFNVTQACTAEATRKALRKAFDLVVIYRTTSLQDAKVCQLNMRGMEVVEAITYQTPIHPNVVYGTFPENSVDLYEAVKLFSAGKRGPKCFTRAA